MAPEITKPGSQVASTGPELDSLAASDRENNRPNPQPQHCTELTLEGLTQFELRMTYAVSDAIALACDPKPTLADMAEWADAQATRERAGLYGAALVNGYVPVSGTRPLAIARRLADFLARCIEHEDDIATLFRAKAHAAARRRA